MKGMFKLMVGMLVLACMTAVAGNPPASVESARDEALKLTHLLIGKDALFTRSIQEILPDGVRRLDADALAGIVVKPDRPMTPGEAAAGGEPIASAFETGSTRARDVRRDLGPPVRTTEGPSGSDMTYNASGHHVAVFVFDTSGVLRHVYAYTLPDPGARSASAPAIRTFSHLSLRFDPALWVEQGNPSKRPGYIIQLRDHQFVMQIIEGGPPTDKVRKPADVFAPLLTGFAKTFDVRKAPAPAELALPAPWTCRSYQLTQHSDGTTGVASICTVLGSDYLEIVNIMAEGMPSADALKKAGAVLASMKLSPAPKS